MTEGMNTIIYPVKDLTQEKKFFNALLGAEPIMDQPYYVGYNVAGQDIGLDPNGHRQGMTGPICYWHVDDIKERLSALLAARGEIQQDVQDGRRGELSGTVQDAQSNIIRLIP